MKLLGQSLLLAAAVLLLLQTDAFSHEDAYGDIGPGYSGLEAGVWRLTGNAANGFDDPVLIYFNFGFSLTKAFYLEDDYEPLRAGPKVGFGFGTPKTPKDYELFWDLMLITRYTFGKPGWIVRPFLDGGFGFINFRQTSFELEGGGGINFHIGQGSIGVNVQHKELFGNSDINRGYVILGNISFYF